MSVRLVLARIGFRWRLAAALACLLLAIVSVVQGRATSSNRSIETIVVAARVLPAGRVLGTGDLTLVRRRPSWPGAVARPTSVLGRTLAGPVAKGEPVTTLRLVDRSLTSGLGADLVALPVDVSTDVRGLVRPGGRVDLLAVPSGDSTGGQAVDAPATLAAARVLVLAVLPPQQSAPGCRMVLAVRRSIAPRVAGARGSNLFQVAALPP